VPRTPALTKPEPLLTVAETAAALRISIRTLQRMMANGEITYVRSGRKSVFFQQRDIDAYLDSTRSNPA
jgi:excisionase family DNA binding protein